MELTDTVSILYKHYSVRFDLYGLYVQIITIYSFQRGVYPAEDFTAYASPPRPSHYASNKLCRVKKYGLTMLVSSDDQVKAYIKKIMSQLDKWMIGGKISKLVVVITNKDTGEHVERWQFDVRWTTPETPTLLIY